MINLNLWKYTKGEFIDPYYYEAAMANTEHNTFSSAARLKPRLKLGSHHSGLVLQCQQGRI